MGQTLTEIAETLRDADKKVQLIYAFNASGKTRLSRAFRELIDPKTEERDDDYRPKVLYYNAFTEDLFYWDNDLTGDTERKLCIQPNAFTRSAFEDLGLDLNVIDPSDADDRRWMIATCYPELREDQRQLSDAMDFVAASGATFHQGDALEHLPRVLAETPAPV